MKNIPEFIRDIFNPKSFQDVDTQSILMALSDPSVRKIWLYDVLEELKNLNLEVDKRLAGKESWDMKDLAVRRKAIQDMLELVLSARRRVKGPNPLSRSFDPDSVTVLTA